jgi:hypothetical protein
MPKARITVDYRSSSSLKFLANPGRITLDNPNANVIVLRGMFDDRVLRAGLNGPVRFVSLAPPTVWTELLVPFAIDPESKKRGKAHR